MAGRHKLFDEKELIKKALTVFWKKGYHMSSADELITAMGVSTGSFYLSFKGGKKELYQKTLVQFASNCNNDFRNKLMQQENPVLYIKEFFLSMTDTPAFLQAVGCYLGNSLIEMSTTDQHSRELIVTLLKEIEAVFCEALRKAQVSGFLKTTQSPELLGRHLINLWNGINVTRRMYGHDGFTKEMIELNLKVLE
ncbi:TetR/AcrR family transcriptional regulator [Dyadobacter subterraneus]|uniref:TetR/AcrR family transcriptional regulator n=1 Tax=Dyadobacter subterraneus TaxID=2773304 RepID=A0ABR9WEF9_9BACT|nr:TetR/AcrR family transcriptional regulator [Dyadobacter subterraneus]MBE9463817.1 TetR/AcrR family transcriptional regulator [Dyadobacter subterraneus]